MNPSKLITPHAPKQVHEIEDLHKQLSQSQLDLFYLQLRLNLLQIQDLHQELPAFLSQMKQQIPFSPMPEYCLVMCYPFSQECFIFHTLPDALPHQDLQLLQQQLLPRSSQLLTAQQRHLILANHDCLMLFMGQSFAVWRVYLNYSDDPSTEAENLPKLDVKNLQTLDAQIQQGFQERTAQQEKIQNILQQERRDFSAELHDSIAQILGFLRLKSAQLNQQCRQQSVYTPLLEQTEELASYTHYAYQQVRELITASRLTYQELDFLTALKKVIAEFEHQSSIAFELDHRVAQVKISAKQSVQLLYIIRESLSNIVRHAHATLATLSIRQNQQQLQIKIADNGRGIQAKMKRQDSFGLEIMQERAERIGAELRICPNRPSGTCVELTLQIKTRDVQKA